MKDSSLNIQRFAYFLIVLTLSGFLLIKTKVILAPLIFAAFFSAMLKPISDLFERMVKRRVIAILLTFTATLLIIFGLIAFWGYLVVNVIGDMEELGEKLREGVYNSMYWLGGQFGWSSDQTERWVAENLTAILDAPFNFVSEGLSSTSNIFAGVLLTGIFTFFFLLYSSSFKNFLIYQFDDHSRERVKTTLVKMEKISRKYLYGLFVVILILGILNSIGLLIIGIEYAFFWGFLGAFLAIIPYVGTALGGFFPFLFAIATGTSFWQPVAVVLLYTIIQTVEGNFITPKIIGSSVKINPFAAVLALLSGGALWGITGLILALPVVAVFRIIFRQINLMKPIGVLLDEDLYEKEDLFRQKFNEDRYRLLNFFRKSR